MFIGIGLRDFQMAKRDHVKILSVCHWILQRQGVIS